jgi:hypothetical protein
MQNHISSPGLGSGNIGFDFLYHRDPLACHVANAGGGKQRFRFEAVLHTNTGLQGAFEKILFR